MNIAFVLFEKRLSTICHPNKGLDRTFNTKVDSVNDIRDYDTISYPKS